MLLAMVVGFLFGFIGSMPLAGPIAVLVFARGVEGQSRAATFIAAGAAIAEGAYAFLAYWGFSEFLARHEFVLPISRLLAGVILIPLGVVLARRRGSAPAAEPPRQHRGGSFLLGFTITALNPTLIATWTVAVTTLASTGWGEFSPALAPVFGLSAAAGIVVWFVLLLALLRRFRARFRQETLDRVVRVTGVLLIGLGAWFAYLFLEYAFA